MSFAGSGLGSRRLWLFLLALSPLAGLAGAALHVRLTKALDVRFAVDREEAIDKARRFAASLGTPMEKAVAYAAPSADQTLHLYYRRLDNEVGRRLQAALPEVRLQVVLVNPQNDEAVEAELTTEGRILGFKRKLDQQNARVGILVFSGGETAPPASEDTPPETASLLAEEAFRERTSGLDFLAFGPAEVANDRQGRVVTRAFVRKATSPELPGLEVESRVEVTGEALSVDTLMARVDPEYAAAHLKPYSTLGIAAVILLALAGLAAVVYACVRYVGKTREKEISHRRNLAVGALVGLSFSIFGALIATDSIGVTLRKAPSDPLFLLGFGGVFVTYSLLGLLFGLFWGATEGEVREVFPGKLTSLDALVLGRITSKNVARATLLGSAVGAWMLLLSALSQWPWEDSPQFGQSLHDFSLAMYARLPWLLALLSPATGTVIAASLGLMLPLAFSFRHVASPRLRWILLGVLAFLGSSPIALRSQPLPASLALTAVAAAVLLVSFYRFDLLTAMVALSFHHFALLLVQIAVTTAFAREIVVLAAGIAALVLMVQTVFVFRGRECGAAEVQPVYALHQAQRRAMQAEVSAAREAQLRLSPETVPQLDGVSLAAACEPARVVGGDFFDFFPITNHRLGIFFAEGGGTGLSAALSIAYAKGLLMPLAQEDDRPSEVVLRLEKALGPLMRGSRKMGLLYAVADASRGTLSGARLGFFPRLLVCGRGGDPRRVAERPLPGLREGAEIREWEVDLRPGDRVVLFTDGVARTLEALRHSPEDWLTEFLASRRDARLDALQAELIETLKSQTRRAKLQGAEDDLSTVLLKFHRLAVAVKEEVA